MFLPSFTRERQSLAIDLGNNNTLIANKETILASQPSWIAYNSANRSIKAVGTEAFEIEGKNGFSIETVKPLRGGVIADHGSAKLMVKAIVNSAFPKQRNWFGFENVISGVPLHTTNVERHAFLEALEQFPTGSRHLIPEPIAAAIGMGLNILEPRGKMVMDIGGGITEIVVISLCGIATYRSVKIAGDAMDEAIQEYIRRKYSLAIGLKTAERIKICAGAVIHDLENAPQAIKVEGKDLQRGIPSQITVSHFEVAEILEPIILQLEDMLIKTLADCPPELAGDLVNTGIHLTGGSSQLRGLKERLERRTHLKVHLDLDAFHSVGKGISKVMRDTAKYRSIFIS